MLIWGSRAVRKPIGSGSFLCPNCRLQQPYRHVSAQRHGHIYWIPLFSIGEPVEYVECQTCMGTYQPAVLKYSEAPSKADFAAKYQEGVLHVMVSMMVADGHMDSRELKMIQNVYRAITSRELPVAEVESTIVTVESSNYQLEAYLADLEPYLNNVGKEAVVKAALAVAAADGSFDDREAELIGQVGSALAMSKAHLRGVVSEVANQ